MTFREDAQKENLELVNFEGKELALNYHLAINKCLIGPPNPVKKLKTLGFFKVVNGVLEVHLRVPVGQMPMWYTFTVRNAPEQQKMYNQALNIRQTEGKSDGERNEEHTDEGNAN